MTKRKRSDLRAAFDAGLELGSRKGRKYTPAEEAGYFEAALELVESRARIRKIRLLRVKRLRTLQRTFRRARKVA